MLGCWRAVSLSFFARRGAVAAVAEAEVAGRLVGDREREADGVGGCSHAALCRGQQLINHVINHCPHSLTTLTE